MPENHLYYGDNLDVLRRYVKDESVDLSTWLWHRCRGRAGKSIDYPRGTADATFKRAPKAKSTTANMNLPLD